ncbi:MAG: hypothetical protein HY796_08250, partial [Elusimicrobia bacterium]|nr:hypothetical protein [Elusimicrobiota bacterium]
MQTYNGWKLKIAKAALTTALVIAAGRFSFAQFSEINPLPQGLFAHSAVLINNMIYVAGGVSDTGGVMGKGGFLNTVYYCAGINADGTLGEWKVASPMPELLGLSMHASAVYDSQVYVLGGRNMFGPRDYVFRSAINADGSLADWIALTPLPIRLMAHDAVIAGGRIYVLGGIARIGRTSIAAADVYYAQILPDKSLGEWKKAASLPVNLFGHKALAANGRIYVMGGTVNGTLYMSDAPNPNVSNAVYSARILEDGSLAPWETMAPLPEAVTFHGASFSVKNTHILAASFSVKNIYVLGGFNGTGVSSAVYYAPVLLDGALGGWQVLAALPKGLVSLASIASEKYLYALGGGLSYTDEPQSGVYSLTLDDTPPETIASVSGTRGANGWHISAVTVTLESTDSLSGVASAYYSLDGKPFAVYASSFIVSAEGGHSLKYYAFDRLWNTEPEKSLAFKIDLGAPVANVAAAPAPNRAGWNNVPVSAVFIGTDAVSGIEHCLSAGSLDGEPKKIISVEGASQTVAGYCMDYAGWFSTVSLSVSIDTAAPSILYTQTPSANEYGWNSGSVTIKFTCADALSGVRSCPADIILGAEGVNIFTPAWAFDYADNSKAVSISGINIDKTLPVSTAAITGTYKNGWYSSSVTVVLTSSDSLSGIEKTGYRVEGAGYSNEEKVYSGPLTFSADGDYIIRYYSRDKAGNGEAEKAVSFKIDRTAPQAGYAIDPPPNSAGWNNTGLRVVFNGTDALSGVEICATFIVSAESVNRQIAGWCRDLAGNVGYSTAVVNVDISSPAVTAIQEPPPNAHGWNNGPVTVMFIGVDAVSGVAYCTADKLITAEGAAQKAYGSCADRAGNLTNAALSVNIDKTVPQIAVSSPVAGVFVATKDRIRVFFAAADNLDPAPAVNAFLTQLEDRGRPRGSRPARAVVASGQSIEPLDIDDGIWRLTVSATDFADNPAFVNGGTFEVIHDVLPPRTEQTMAGGLWFGAGETTYITGSAELKLSSIDDLVELNDGIGLGVKKQGIGVRVENIGLIREFSFENTNPGQGAVFVSTFRLDQEADGVYGLAYNSEDVLGNFEKTNISTFSVDNTAPKTEYRVEGIGYRAGENIYHNSGAVLELIGVDVSSNGVASGLKKTNYRWDDGGWMAYISGLEISSRGEGRHILAYYSADNLDNTEAVNNYPFIADFTAPQTAFNRAWGPAYLNYVSTWTLFELAPVDPGGLASGVKETAYNINDGGTLTSPLKFTLPSAGGNYLVKYRSRDNVENLEVEKSSPVFVDATQPITTLVTIGGKQYPGAEAGSFYASLDTKFGFIAVDPVVGGGASGVKTTGYRVEGTGYSGEEQMYSAAFGLSEGIRTLSYYAKDNVDNTEVFKSTQVYIDNTAPVTSFDISGPLYIKDGARYITQASVLTFTAADPVIKEVSAGVERIETAVDGRAYSTYTSALKFSEGRHTIKYRAIDNMGNVEAERILELRSDATPPVTVHNIGSPYYVSAEGVNYITPETPLTFSATDPITMEAASGVERIETAIDGGAYSLYAAPLKFPEGRHTIKYRAIDNVGNLEAEHTLQVQSDSTAREEQIYSKLFGLTEGIRTLSYYAKDNVGNAEIMKSTVIYVDGTAPVSVLSLSGDQYKDDKQYISPRTDIVITAADPVVNGVASGVKTTGYRVEGIGYSNEENVYASPFKLTSEGKHIVSFYSTDHVNNAEAVKKAELWVDATPPATALTISGARYSPPGDDTIYLTKDSGIVLTTADPVSNETASGVLLTKYRVDGGNWQVYLGSFTITTEGRHTLQYYSLDRVQNTEVPKTAKLAVDNTPPVTTISLGEPKFEVFGLPILTPDTPVTLSAFDPISNNVASGLNSIYYELEDAHTGNRAPLTAYLEPFKLAQGAFIIRYWSKDNVSNAEIPKETRVSVTTWREDGLIAVSGLNMSGTADISGTVKSNAVVSVSGNARILGDVTASTITVSGKAQITGQQVSGATPVHPEPVYMAAITESAKRKAEKANSAIPKDYLIDGKLVVTSKAGLTLSTGIYYFKSMELSGGSSVTIAGKVDILVEGGIKISGGSSVNAGGAASSLNIFVSAISSVNFAGGADFLACLYAPYSHIKLAGNAVLGGHYFAKTAAVSGTGNFVQSGESLPQVVIVTADSGGKKKVSALGTEVSAPKVLAG